MYLHVHFKLHMSVPATCTHLHSSPPYTVPAIPANCLPSTPCTFNSTYSLFPYTRPLLTVSASFIACLSLSSSSSPSLSFSNSSWHLVSRRARNDFILGVPSSFSPTLILYCNQREKEVTGCIGYNVILPICIYLQYTSQGKIYIYKRQQLLKTLNNYCMCISIMYI